MYKTSTTVPDYRIYEYPLILSPTGELWQQLLSFKNDFARRYKAWLASGTKPHITLVSFLADLQTGHKIIRRLQTIGAGVTPFDIVFKNFGMFFKSSTVFVNVETKAPIQDLVRELKQARDLLKRRHSLAPIFVNDPHPSLCRHLSPWQFQNGWNEYSDRSFNGSFMANCMTLLRRPYKQRGYETIGQFTFQSTPILPKQGRLFM